MVIDLCKKNKLDELEELLLNNDDVDLNVKDDYVLFFIFYLPLFFLINFLLSTLLVSK